MDVSNPLKKKNPQKTISFQHYCNIGAFGINYYLLLTVDAHSADAFFKNHGTTEDV